MPVYFYWGDDGFALEQAVNALRQRILDPDWSSFNFDKILPDQADSTIQGLNQAMTPPFGAGSRLVWLVETTICQRCSEETLTELERTLPNIPDSSVLLLTSSSKPDGRLKSTKLLQKHAETRDFTVIPPWKTDLLVKQVQQVAREVAVKLTPGATELLVEAVGNDTRQLYNELEKLRLYAGASQQALDETTIASLVTASSQNSLQLAAAVRQGDISQSLDLVADLLRQNLPPLAIVRTLINQFRTWLWIKTLMEAGERDDQKIAKAAEIPNPKRLFFLKKEVERIPAAALAKTLPILMELDFALKDGADERSILQTKVIELCQVMRPGTG